MFFQKANPYHDPKTGRFTNAPSGRGVLTSPARRKDDYVPATLSVMNADGSVNWESAGALADAIDSYASGESIGELDVYVGVSEADTSLAIVRQLQGFNGKPRLIDSDTLSSTAGDTLYRGDYDVKHSETLRSGTFFPNQGMGGNGTYSTKVYSEALAYTYMHGSSKEPGGLTTFKLDPRAKVHRGSLVPYRDRTYVDGEDRFFRDLERDSRLASTGMSGSRLTRNQHSILEAYFSDRGRFLAALGYDAYVPFTGAYEREDHVVILNRTAMLIADNDPSVSMDMLRGEGLI